MAPTAPATAPRKRPSVRAKALARLADPLLPRKLHRAENVVTDSFIDSKKDKRLIRHSSFVSRIQKAQAPASRKRRRPSKKLVATLDSLGDALEEIQDEVEADDEQRAAAGKIRHKSLRSKPGALKRKEKLVRGEMDRFGKNMAQLASISEPAATAAPPAKSGRTVEMETEDRQSHTGKATPRNAAPSSTSNRWAALRGFISSTMEQNPAFLNP